MQIGTTAPLLSPRQTHAPRPCPTRSPRLLCPLTRTPVAPAQSAAPQAPLESPSSRSRPPGSSPSSSVPSFLSFVPTRLLCPPGTRPSLLAPPARPRTRLPSAPIRLRLHALHPHGTPRPSLLESSLTTTCSPTLRLPRPPECPHTPSLAAPCSPISDMRLSSRRGPRVPPPESSPPFDAVAARRTFLGYPLAPLVLSALSPPRLRLALRHRPSLCLVLGHPTLTPGSS